MDKISEEVFRLISALRGGDPDALHSAIEGLPKDGRSPIEQLEDALIGTTPKCEGQVILPEDGALLHFGYGVSAQAGYYFYASINERPLFCADASGSVGADAIAVWRDPDRPERRDDAVYGSPPVFRHPGEEIYREEYGIIPLGIHRWRRNP